MLRSQGQQLVGAKVSKLQGPFANWARTEKEDAVMGQGDVVAAQEGTPELPLSQDLDLRSSCTWLRQGHCFAAPQPAPPILMFKTFQ